MRKAVLLFWSITGLFWLSLYIYVPVVQSYSIDLGADLFMVGLISGVYGLTQMLLRIPAGIACDRLGLRRPFIIAGIVFAVLAGLPVCFVQSPWSIFVCRMLGGAAAAAWVPFTVHFSTYFSSDEAPRAMGLLSAANHGGQALAVILCGVLSGFIGRPALFAAGAAVAGLTLVLSFFTHEHSAPDAPASGKVSMRSLASVPFEGQTTLIAILGLLTQYIVFATAYGFTPVVAKSLGADDLNLSGILAMFIIPAAIFSALSGKISSKLGVKRSLIICFTLFTVVCALTPFAVSVTELYFVSILCGAAQGVAFPMLMGLVLRSVSAGRRSTAMGFFQAVYGLGMFLGPVIVGAFGSTHGGLTAGFLSTCAVAAVSAVISLRLKSAD